MTDKGTKALRAANIRISLLVWKLHKAIDNAKEQDTLFTEVDAVSKLATDSFKLFLEYGVLDESAHLQNPKNRSPRPHLVSPDRRQNVRTTPGSEESAGKRSKSATQIKDVRPTPFCDDVKVTLNFEDDQTQDRVNKCIAELECQNQYPTCQVELAEKEKSDASRKEEMKYNHLESEVNRYKAEINDLLYRDSNHMVHANRYRSERDLARCVIKELKIELEKRKDNSLQSDLEYLKKTLKRTELELKSVKEENTALQHANENKTKMIEETQNRAEDEIKEANDAIVYYKEEQQRYKKVKDENNAQIVKLRTEKEDAYGRIAKLRTERDDANKKIAKLTTEKDDANRRLVKLRTERDQLNSDAARLKVEKDELLNLLQKQKSSNNAGRHCEDALNKQLHEKDMECKQSKKIVENLSRKLDEIQSQQKESLKPRDREDLKWEENYNQKLIEENEGLRNTVFEMEQQLAGQNREDIDTEYQYRCDIDRYKQERNSTNSKLNTLQEQMKNKMAKLKEALYYEDRKQLENRIQDLEDQISDTLGKPSIADEGYSKNCQQEQLDPVSDELSIMKTKLSSLEDELKINKDRKYVLEKENEEINKKYQDVLRKLRESESRHDTEMTRNKETADRLQNDLDRLKSQENLQKQTSRGELDSLKEQRTQLERDKGILRTKIYSLENEKIGLEERINKAELILPNQQTLREENSDLKESLETMKKAMENMEEKYKKETAIRINTDGTTTKLKNENDRLQKESNRATIDVDRITREKEDLAHELQHEIDAAKVEHDNCKKDKNELTSIFQQKAKRDQEKIYQLEKERETIVARDLESGDQRCTKCDQYERTLTKLKKNNQELQDRDLESKNQRCTKCDQYERTLAKLKKENQELQDKLSVAAEKHVEEQVPSIGNLCDINRPTALSRKFCSLYTDEYADAMEVIEKSMDEAGAVHVMLEWLKSCYNWCERLAREQRGLLTTESIGFMNKYHGQKIDYVVSDSCLIHVKEFQKNIAVDTLTAVINICHVKSVNHNNLIHNSYIVKYIQKCTELCWRMQITDPPMCLKFYVKNGENLDKTLYNAFTKNGSKIEYLVWPILFLHKSGPLMAKGVAQGT